MEPSAAFEGTEALVIEGVRWLRLAIETTGALIIALGVLIALGAFVRAFARRHDATYATEGYNGVRLTLARYLALALEFQLGADILSTAVAPTLDDVIQLGAIAAIRTGLNYFLSQELERERRQEAATPATAEQRGAPG
jgi:uncharacterized membrane protein